MKKGKDLRLLRKGIKHWCLDIRRLLLKGGEITGALYWKGNCDKVKMFSADCALCMEYNLTCDHCPLNMIGEKCSGNDSAYLKFYCNLDIESANNMIATLIKAYWIIMSEENDGV